MHQTLSPVRELFMVENIKKLVKPGLVQIGEAHLEGLKNKIPDSKLHASYADFVADTNKL